MTIYTITGLESIFTIDYKTILYWNIKLMYRKSAAQKLLQERLQSVRSLHIHTHTQQLSVWISHILMVPDIKTIRIWEIQTGNCIRIITARSCVSDLIQTNNFCISMEPWNLNIASDALCTRTLNVDLFWKVWHGRGHFT